MEKNLKILVFDDNENNRKAAEAQLGKYNLTVVGTYDEAQELLCQETFDVVLTDLLVPVSSQMLGNMKEHFAGQEMPVGIFIGLLAAVRSRAKYVAVFTDSDHHAHPASACFDAFNNGGESKPTVFTVEGSKVILSNTRNWVGYFLPENLSDDLLSSGRLRNYLENGGGFEGLVHAKNWAALLKYLLE